eukprot:2427537-Amphidinium_carterae.1
MGGPIGPVIGGPIGPVIGGPIGPVMGGPIGPVIGSPIGPTNVLPSSLNPTWTPVNRYVVLLVFVSSPYCKSSVTFQPIWNAIAVHVHTCGKIEQPTKVTEVRGQQDAFASNACPTILLNFRQNNACATNTQAMNNTHGSSFLYLSTKRVTVKGISQAA